MSTLTTTRAATVVAIAGLSVALLTGCIGNPVEDLVSQGVEDAVEGATGGEVNVDGELPEGFPASVPLVDGDVSFSAGAGGVEGWVVIITSSASDPVAEAATELEGAGFTEDTTVAGGGVGAKVYSNAEYLVLLAGDGSTVTYTVTPQP
ncbi:hypothetical protein ACFWN7_04830 [Agromyces sp. NPDC058484]|uniref:hypothetical protein n=1 Tax=Agromyces sp. NPDC058484 TaxID=3346524 RepID=UPI003659C6F2